MESREVSQLIVDYRSDASGNFLLLNWWALGRNQSHEMPLTVSKDELTRLCENYWKALYKIVSPIFTRSGGRLTRYDPLIKQEMDQIRDLSSELTGSIFDHHTLSLLFHIVEYCSVINIATTLLLIPWSMLQNIYIRDGKFLFEHCTVVRSLMLREPVLLQDNPISGQGLYVDAVLDHEWGSDLAKGYEQSSYKSIKSRISPLIFSDLTSLFQSMQKFEIIHWICENQFSHSSHKGRDQLRIAQNCFCTESSLHSKRVDRKSVVFLLSCGHNVDLKDNPSIASIIAYRNGCVVVAPTLPIPQTAALRLLHLMLRARHLLRHKITHTKRKVTNLHYDINIPRMISRGKPAGVLLMLFNIYGNGNSETFL